MAMLNELKVRAKADIMEAFNIGYRDGLCYSATMLRVIAAEVNVSVDELRAEIEAEAGRLETLGREKR